MLNKSIIFILTSIIWFNLFSSVYAAQTQSEPWNKTYIKNVDRTGWLSKDLKALNRNMLAWYKENNTIMEPVEWFAFKKVDFIWSVLGVILIMYLTLRFLTKSW